MTTTTITTTNYEAFHALQDGSRIAARSSATGLWEVLRDDERIGWLTEQERGLLRFTMNGKHAATYTRGLRHAVNSITSDLTTGVGEHEEN